MHDYREPPSGFTDLRTALSRSRFHIGYHRSDNFTGAQLPGYGVPGAWLLDEAAARLVAVEDSLQKQGFGLVIYDSYRPLRATRAMQKWCQDTDQEWILRQGYVALRSTHHTGNTVDLSIFYLEDGREVDMGTPWDTFDEASHLHNATGDILRHRLVLYEAMRSQGWREYSQEWWHFDLPSASGRPHRDVPYARWEADEPPKVTPL